VEDNRAFKLEIDKKYGIIIAQYTHKLPHKIVTSSDFVTKIKNIVGHRSLHGRIPYTRHMPDHCI
jgi:hypothetical protein